MRIIDIGLNFGMPVSRVFQPWDHQRVSCPTIAEAERQMATADLVCFGGGADIHPSLYNHKNMASHTSDLPSKRDLFEVEIWKLAVELKKPILGICRGAQFACAMSGGSLIQDVNAHAGAEHELICDDGRKELFMSTVHHQMMYLGDVKNYNLIAWTNGLSTRATTDPTKIRVAVPMEKEPEIVFFKDTNALAIQGHPEFYSNPNVPPVKYTRELVEKYLGVHP